MMHPCSSDDSGDASELLAARGDTAPKRRIKR